MKKNALRLAGVLLTTLAIAGAAIWLRGDGFTRASANGWPLTLSEQATALRVPSPEVPEGRLRLVVPAQEEGSGQIIGSPRHGAELALPAGAQIVTMTVSKLAPRVVAAIEMEGRYALVDWWVGKPAVVRPFEHGRPQSIAFHPNQDVLFVSANRGGRGVVVRMDIVTATAKALPLWQSSTELGPIVTSKLPFCLSKDLLGAQPEPGQTHCVHRVFFAERHEAGWQVRSISEDGRAAYLAIGPQSEASKPAADEWLEPPNTLVATDLVPLEFDAEGSTLWLQDKKSCRHLAIYGAANWARLEATGICGGYRWIAPNGLDTIEWSAGRPGIQVNLAGTKSVVELGRESRIDRFAGMTPDGQGLFGSTAEKLVYVPVVYPLGDLENAWLFNDLLKGQLRVALNANGGAFLPTNVQQLYNIYEESRYSSGPWKRPEIVTTDIFWETAAAAFQGVFSEIERHQAVPAFSEFVRLAVAELGGNFQERRIVQELKAANAVLEGREGDGGAMLQNNPQNRPRGHYMKSAELGRYFSAMRSLAHMPRTSGDVEPLRHLSQQARAAAARWMDAYRPFIAKSKSLLPYGESPRGEADGAGQAGYAVFPLSSGFDNHAIAHLIHKPETGGLVSANGEFRLLPSAVDLAAAFGNRMASEIVGSSGSLTRFPALGKRIDGLSAEWRDREKAASLYEHWLEVIGEEWREGGLPWLGRSWESKRLQSGLAAWTTLRHSTVLVNEVQGSEGGEGGPEFERMVIPEPQGFVEPNPGVFEGLAHAYGYLDSVITASELPAESKRGIKERIAASRKEVAAFAGMARKEINGERLSSDERRQIKEIAGIAEYNFLIFSSMMNIDGRGGVTTPDPVAKIVDVAGRPEGPVLEVAIGHPLKWLAVVPKAGRRQLVIGSVYSFYEFQAPQPKSDDDWRKIVTKTSRPTWVSEHLHQ